MATKRQVGILNIDLYDNEAMRLLRAGQPAALENPPKGMLREPRTTLERAACERFEHEFEERIAEEQALAAARASVSRSRRREAPPAQA